MRTFLVFCLFFFFFCQHALAQPDESLSQKSVLEKFIQDYYQAMSDRDWEKYAGFFTPEATLTTIWQAPGTSAPQIVVSSLSDFLAKTGEGPDSQPIFEEKALRIQIEIRNNLASVWTHYEAKFGTPENLMQWKGYDLFSLIQHQGAWKIVSLSYTDAE